MKRNSPVVVRYREAAEVYADLQKAVNALGECRTKAELEAWLSENETDGRGGSLLNLYLDPLRAICDTMESPVPVLDVPSE